jgi:hemolysin activation/secretion protein
MAFAPGAALLLAAAAQPASIDPLPASPLIIDRARSDRAPPALPSTPPPPAQGDGIARVEAGGAAVPIQGIRFEGAEVPVPVADAARAFMGQPATAATLGRLAKAMSDAYTRTPVALYTVVIPAQDMTSGAVRVQVAEGFIEDIRYPNGASPLIRAYGAKLKAEAPLTRRALERYLSLMRDIPGAKLDVQLLRGTQPGGVILSLAPTRERSDFAFGFDNRGIDALGEGQFRADAHAYGLLRDGDRTDLNLMTATNFKRYRYAALAHSTPIGADGVTASLSAGYLETRPRRSTVTGEARTMALSVNYPVIRGYRRNLTMGLALDGLNSDAALLGVVISSDRTRALRLATGYSQVAATSVVTAGATVSQGLDILGARGFEGFTDTVFTKVNARATWDRQIGKRLIMRLRASGQYSDDRLAAAERFAVGGSEFGRAFDAAILSGDRGIAGLFELAVRPALPKPMEGSEVYGFVDHARIGIRPRLFFQGAGYDLASAGAGVRIAFTTKAWLELEGARNIDSPYPGYRGDWRFNLGWRLVLGRK